MQAQDDGIKDVQLKSRMQTAFRKAFYYLVAAFEKNPERKFLLAFILDFIQNYHKVGHKYPLFQLFISDLLVEPVHFDDGLKRSKVPQSGHGDYSENEPHVLDSEECNCSALALILRYYLTSIDSIRQRFVKCLNAIACTDKTKKKFASEHFNHLAYILPSNDCFSEYPPMVHIMTAYLATINVDKEFLARCNIETYLKLIIRLTEEYAVPVFPEHGGHTDLQRDFYCVQSRVEKALKLQSHISSSKHLTKLYLTRFEIVSNMAPVFRTNFKPENDEMLSVLQRLWVYNFWSCGEEPIDMINEFIVHHHKQAAPEGLVTTMSVLSEIIVSQDKLKMQEVEYTRWYLVDNFVQLVVGYLLFEPNPTPNSM